MRTTTKPQPPTAEVINMSSLTKRERLMLENAISPYGQPDKVLDRKIERLAEMLNCSEEEAEHVFFNRL